MRLCRFRKKRFRPEILFLVPSLVGVAVFYLIPFVVVIVYSFVDDPIHMQFVGLDNYQNLIGGKAFQLAAKNTASFSALAVPLAVILSLCLAMMIEKRIPGKSKLRTMLLSPLTVPVASVVLIWQVLFSKSGPISEVVLLFGGNKTDWLQSPYAQLVIVLLFLWRNLGYNMILFSAALSNVPKDLLEVALVERASTWFTFWQVKLRFISPTILFVTILSLINSFKIFREVHLLSGDYSGNGLYFLQHFMNNTFATLDYQKLATAAVLMALVVVTIIVILFIGDSYLGKDVEG